MPASWARSARRRAESARRCSAAGASGPEARRNHHRETALATQKIQRERVRPLNDAATRDGDHVVYWMQQSQRAECNHALEYAIQRANEHQQRLLVVFGLMDDYPEANLRHYRFMLEGLTETQQSLEGRGVRMVVRRGHPADVATAAATDATLLVCDRGYLRHQKEWRARVARESACPVIEVESDVVVPVDVVSSKAEYTARTIRPKIHRQLERFLVDLRTTPLEKDSLNLPKDGLDLGDLDAALNALKLDRSVEPVSQFFRGGTSEARRILRRFLDEQFHSYVDNRNQPQTSDTSHMSMYLHFGQIAPLYVALQGRAARADGDEARDSFLEELIVRRELAQNYANFHPAYDRYEALPDWARRTLDEHRDDVRDPCYTRQQLEDAETHDPYWNAAMREMRFTGYMHNYMRMYWGKKILEWSPSPEEAFRTALALNNRYFLDGRDANSYANVAWCFGQHDRAWTERPIFGKVRYMAASGLERKTDPQAYVEKVDRLVERAAGDE